MPVRETLQPIKVKVLDKTKLILELYQSALEKHGLPLKDSETSARAAAAIGDTKNRDGLWIRYVTSTLESLTSKARGAKQVDLPAEDLIFSPPAEMLRRSYLDFLNRALLAQGVTAAETEAKEIESPFALVRILLYRLVSIALSDGLDVKNDGDTLLAVLHDFLREIFAKECLSVRKTILHSPEPSIFAHKLTREHSRWIEQIEAMVEALKTVNQPRQAITEALSAIKAIEQVTQRQLIAILDNAGGVDDYSSGWLDTALHSAEVKLIQQAPKGEGMDRRLLLLEKEGDRIAIERLVLAQVPDDRKKVALCKRYMLLRRACTIQDVLSHIDLLLTYAGWVPVLGGLFNAEALSQLMLDYSQQCDKNLELSDVEMDRLGASSKRALIRYQAVKGGILQRQLFASAVDLMSLNDRALNQRMMRMMGSSLRMLVNLQDELGGQYTIVDATKLALLDSQLSLSSSAKTSALAPARAVKKTIQDLDTTDNSIDSETIRILIMAQQQQATQESGTVVATQLLHQMLIAEKKDTETLDLLSLQHPDLNAYYLNQDPYYGTTALHIAARTGNVSAAQWLLRQGVNVNINTVDKETPLDKAVKGGHEDMVRLLKGHGGMSAVAEVATQKLHKIIGDEDLTEEDSSVTSEIIGELHNCIKAGADINGTNQLPNAWRGDRPLHTLLVKGNKKLIQWFMGMGADPTLVDERRSETPWQRLKRVCRNLGPIEEFLTANFSQHFPGKEDLTNNPASAAAALSQYGAIAARVQDRETVVRTADSSKFTARP